MSLVNLLWLGMVLFALPGNWLMILTAFVFDWLIADKIFSVWTLGIVILLAVFGEILEFFGGAGGARKTGAGKRAAVGAIIGAVIGAVIGTFIIPVPVFGTLLGSCFGAGLGAWAMEITRGSEAKQAVRSAAGAGLGQLVGITSKFAVGVIIWIILAIAATTK